MGVGAGLYMCDVVKKFKFAISSPDEFLSSSAMHILPSNLLLHHLEKNFGLTGVVLRWLMFLIDRTHEVFYIMVGRPPLKIVYYGVP